VDEAWPVRLLRTRGPREIVSDGQWSRCGELCGIYLDGLGIKFQPFLLVDQELLHILALITLKLDHLAHFGVVDNGAITS